MKKPKLRKSGLMPGDFVAMVNCYEATKNEGRMWEVISEPWECCGSEIIKLKGISGGFDTSCLIKVPKSDIGGLEL